MLKVLEGGKGRNEKQQDEVKEGIQFTLDDLAREGARRMIAAALKMEADEYVVRHAHERGSDDHAMVVRNGTGRPRSVTVGGVRFVDGKQRERNKEEIRPEEIKRAGKIAA